MSVIDLYQNRRLKLYSCIVGLFTLSLVSLNTTARAQSSTDRAAAQVLFDEARSEMKAGATKEVCAKFQESQRLDPQIGTQFNLADCFERIDHFASAWINFHELFALTRARGQKERAEVVEARAAALEPRLTKLRVEFSGAAPPELVIRRGEQKISLQSLGTAIPIDAGSYLFTAVAPGYKLWQKQIELAGEGAQLTVTIPALEALPPEPKPEPVAAPAPSPIPSGSAPTDTASSSLHPRAVAGLTVGSIGLIAVAVGAGFGGDAVAKRSDAEPLCKDEQQACTAEGQSLMRSAIDSARASTALFIAGGVLVATGATLWLTAPSSDTAVTLNAGPSSANLQVLTRF